MIILIAIETTSRPADRRDDDAYSTEPHDLMNVVADDDRKRSWGQPPKRRFAFPHEQWKGCR
jgi:hypothetical protein